MRDRRPNPWQIGGVDARTRLVQAVHHEARTYVEGPPTQAQIAMVLHALADHTSLLVALNFDPPVDGFWPEASSVGRFLHHYGDYINDHAEEPLP
jgi:hypothetical protein